MSTAVGGEGHTDSRHDAFGPHRPQYVTLQYHCNTSLASVRCHNYGKVGRIGQAVAFRFILPITLAEPMARPTLIRLPRLLERRISRGLSQEELAIQAGTTRLNVGRIERGGDTHPKMAVKLAVALDCRLEDLRPPEQPTG